ncbi:PIG-L deacetylase family protein [Streptomyces sp. Act143]|uniref:PIG-L deacetylase family protein n=1 Tax=Streptomyces sp. Act143 TaxID=2200760 RepID=UPI001C629B34|nr:PIG-L deacetylase family protein [Streptomyces sp. Act143]
MADTGAGRGLPGGMRRVLAVVAHPDDESFGLGGLLALLSGSGVPTAVLCFTHGEASTLHGRPGDLHALRADELACAARELGVERVELSGHPDGGLDRIPPHRLAGEVARLIDEQRPSHLLVFDLGGVTGHRDHQRATGAVLFAARGTGVAVVGWTLPRDVAERLNAEFGTSFLGRDPTECRVVGPVPREWQGRAIACHASQSSDNPVLRRRLELLGDREYLRVLE